MKENSFIPNFLIPGFAKSGTSSLHEYLNQHPNIQMSSIKEPHNYSKLKHYQHRFDIDNAFAFPNIFDKPIDNATLLGESSTSYAICDYSPKLIYKDNPNMKFIIIARDPLDRIVSHYNWLLSLGDVTQDFHTEIENWLNKKFDINNPIKNGYKYYTATSRYGMQLQNYLHYFSIENFHFLSTENLKKNPQKELNRCFQFLGLPAYSNINLKKTNQTQSLAIKYEVPKSIQSFKYFMPQPVRNILKKRLGKKYRVKNQLQLIKELPPKEVALIRSILQEDIDLFKKLAHNNFKEWRNF